MICKCGQEPMDQRGANSLGSIHWCRACGTLCIVVHQRAGEKQWTRPKYWLEMNDENEIIKLVTHAVRLADRAFQDSGGSSRHWVRDWFLPYLRHEGLIIMQEGEIPGWKPASHWDHHNDHPVDDWKAEVLNGDTRQSYIDWVNSRIEEAKEEADGDDS